MTKKRNMAYWDSMKNESEQFISTILSYVETDKKLELDEDDRMELSKGVLEHLLEMLKGKGIDTDAAFPYVNENY